MRLVQSKNGHLYYVVEITQGEDKIIYVSLFKSKALQYMESRR